MPTLTRRRDQDRHQEWWQVFHGDVCVGWIGERAGVPKGVAQWGWHCGFYPLTHRGIRADGVADTFDQARSEFEVAWRDYLPRCTDADFAEHRYQRAATAWKYSMWDAGCKMPMQTVDDRSRCFCGVEITAKSTSHHIRARHMEAA
jgi:hypothetical protein